jgi:hypothetical protein
LSRTDASHHQQTAAGNDFPVQNTNYHPSLFIVTAVRPVPVSLLTDFSCVVFVALDVGVKHIAFHRSNSIAGKQEAVLMLEFYHEHGWFLIITFHISKCLFYHDLELRSSSLTLTLSSFVATRPNKQA